MRRGTILFVGGDAGGARALDPVARSCVAAGQRVRLIGHGPLAAEWKGDPGLILEKAEDPVAFLSRENVRCLVFSSSVADGYALRIARLAAAASIPTVHVLDHWSNYALRMRVDGGPLFVPTLYTAIDERCRLDAVAAGIPAGILAVVGQPALGDVRPVPRSAIRATAPFNVVFVAEPVIRDQGADPLLPSFRGYTELDAIAAFAKAVPELDVRLAIKLLPHPRQTIDEVMQAWRSAAPDVAAEPLHAKSGREALPKAAGLIGMASMLLYEGWLSGLPVLSIQPNVRANILGALQERSNVFMAVLPEQIGPAVRGWAGALAEGPGDNSEAAGDIARHRDAPQRIASLIEDLSGARSKP